MLVEGGPGFTLLGQQVILLVAALSLLVNLLLVLVLVRYRRERRGARPMVGAPFDGAKLRGGRWVHDVPGGYQQAPQGDLRIGRHDSWS